MACGHHSLPRRIRFFINQPHDTPRWAVERWGATETRFIEAVGVPEIDGDILTQRRLDSSLVVTSLERPFEDSGLLPSRASVTHHSVCASCDVPTVVRGDLYGTIELFRWPEGIGTTMERLAYDVVAPPFSPAAPVIYAVKALDHGQMVAVAGLEPQRIIVLAEDADGNLQQNAVFAVPSTNAIRSPLEIGRIAGEVVVIPLRSRVVLFEPHDSSFFSVPAPGVTAVHGGFPRAGATMVALSTVNGAAAGLFFEDEPDSIRWEWIDTDVASVKDSPQDGLVVFHRDGLFVAMRIAL